MKNLIKILSLLLVMSAVTFIACNKENVLADETKQNLQQEQTNSQLRIYNFNNDIKNVETGLDDLGILSFDTKESYLETLAQLEKLSIEYNEELTDLEDENVNYNQVYFDFAEKFNFKSLFIDINEREEKWLEETEGSDINEDPDNHFVSSYEERSLYNTNSEVIVGKKIYKRIPSGYFVINSINFDLLKTLRSDIDLYNLPNGVEYFGDYTQESIVGGRLMASCATMESNSDFKNNPSNTYRIKWRTELNSPLFSQRTIEATTKSYKCKKIKNGKCVNWNKHKAKIKAVIYGDVSQQENDVFGYTIVDCSLIEDAGASSITDTKKSVTRKIKIGYKRAKSGDVHSDHEGNGINHTNDLTF